MIEPEGYPGIAHDLETLRRLLRWCVEHDGECLGDHPGILAQARDAITPRPVVQHDTGPKLGIVDAVKHEIEHGNFDTQRYWHHRIKGLSSSMHVALAETTHDSGPDTVVMHYCTEGNEVLKRIYRGVE